MKLLLNNGCLMIVITAVAWSGNAIAARAVHEAVPPIGLAFWRWVGTVPIFLILTERDGAVATVILNRADKLNALNREMWAGVGEAFRALDGDANIRCVILRGAGEEAMGPGAEFAEARSNPEQAADYGGLMHAAMRAIRDCRHPTVAQIHGLCVGGALELALSCDMRICGEDSRFGIPVNRLGLVMAYPESAGSLIPIPGKNALTTSKTLDMTQPRIIPL